MISWIYYINSKYLSAYYILFVPQIRHHGSSLRHKELSSLAGTSVMHTSLQFVPWLYHDCASLQTPQEGKLRDPLNRATTSRMVNRALGHRTEFQPHFLNQQTNKQSACGGNYLLGSWKLGQEPSASSHRPRHPSRARGILPQGSPALSPGAWTLAGSSQLWLGLGKNV